MSKDKLNKLDEKKKALEQQLSRIQSDLDHSIDAVKEGVSDTLDPKKVIQKYPLHVFGASLFLGYLLGKDKRSGNNTGGSSSSDGIGSMVGRELKHQLTKRAMRVLMDFVDNKIEDIQQRDSE
ncbi:hypothetical protein AB2B38_002350 [Balneola sp. MJW-20]|uniref:hypothetical protein n=1 Tax=Gracilimonas aurantiaca TaxID=3234185 RepID=UPI003467EB92